MKKEDLKNKYFSEGLSESEGRLLQQYLDEDAEFNELFQFEKQLQSTLKKSERQSLKEQLKSFDNQGPGVKSHRSSYHNLRIAASLLVFFAVGWIAYSLLFGLDEDQLYAQNFESYPNVIQSFERGADEIDESLASEGLRYYELGDFINASEALLKLNEETSDLYVDFYLAQCYLSLNKYQEAKTLLRFLVNEKQGFYSESLWYLSLVEIKLNNIKEARTLLNTLVKNGNYKVVQAKELLELLD